MTATKGTTPPTVYQALAAVMEDVGAVRKGDRNTQQNFSFRGIDAVVNAVSPALRKHGVIVVPEVLNSEHGTVEVGQRRTLMGHVQLTVKYTFYGPAGDSVPTTVIGEAMDSGDKASPKAMSVAFRTALLQALALPTDEPDPDEHTYQRSDAQHEQTRQRSQPPAITAGQMKALHAAFNDLGITDRDAGLAYCHDVIGRPIESTKALTKSEASQVIDTLKRQLDEAVEADARAAEEAAAAESESNAAAEAEESAHAH